jgi:hypothetical protein
VTAETLPQGLSASSYGLVLMANALDMFQLTHVPLAEGPNLGLRVQSGAQTCRVLLELQHRTSE